MTRDDVIRMAREAGMAPHLGRTDDDGKYIPAINALKTSVPVQWLERFYVLAAAAEREACLSICRQTAAPDATRYGDGYNQAAIDIEAAIRARG